MLSAKSRFLRSTMLTAATLVVSAAGGPAHAEGDFYDGKTLTAVVPYGASGGTARWMRAVEPYLDEALGPEADVEVIFKPGGGSITGANEWALRMDHDGTNVLISSGSTVMPWLLGQEQVMYDFANLKIIAAMPVGGVVYANPEVVSAVEDLQKPSEPLVTAGVTAVGSDLPRLIAFDLLGLDVQPVMGYKSTGEAHKAFLTDEANIVRASTPGYFSYVEPEVEAGNAVPLFTLGVLDESGEIVRDPVFPDLPTVRDVYKQLHGEEPSGPQWNAYKAVTAATWALLKTVWMHEDTPQEAYDSLLAAFEKVAVDPDFQKAMAEQVGDYPFILGDTARGAFFEGVEIDQEARDSLIAFLEKKFSVSGLD